MTKPIGYGGRDYPDFHSPDMPHQSDVEISLTELAIRGGWNGVMERTGNVLYHENWHNGENDWYEVFVPGTGRIELTTDGSYMSAYAIALVSSVTDQQTYLGKEIAIPYLSTFGVEVSWLAKASFNWFMVSLSVYTGTRRLLGSLKYDLDNTRLLYRDEDNNFQVIDNIDVTIDAYTGWHTLKLVADYASDSYTRCFFDLDDYALTDTLMHSSVDAREPTLRIGLTVGAAALADSRVLFDNVILTINEPL